MIGFNEPYLSGKELDYIRDAVASKKISGNGKYTDLCHNFFEKRYGYRKCLLTTSCTDALEMAAILLKIVPGDEVIMPSFTFVSTANAFVLRGAKIVFCDSMKSEPNLDASLLESLITPRTKVIVPVHYAGVSCDMDVIMNIANKYDLFVVEDAAQAIDGYYTNKRGERVPLGSIGHLAAFSFHETKNIISGEGGMLVINDDRFIQRSEIIWEKGTNRASFYRGEVDKYGWVDVGSSFLPSDMIAAYLFAQLENIDRIQMQRLKLWMMYQEKLQFLESGGIATLPVIPAYSSNNAHMFYLVCESESVRTDIIDRLKSKNIHAVFHYQSLHKSPFYSGLYSGPELPNCDRFTKQLLRLPMFFDLTEADQSLIVQTLGSI